MILFLVGLVLSTAGKKWEQIFCPPVVYRERAGLKRKNCGQQFFRSASVAAVAFFSVVVRRRSSAENRNNQISLFQIFSLSAEAPAGAKADFALMN